MLILSLAVPTAREAGSCCAPSGPVSHTLQRIIFRVCLFKKKNGYRNAAQSLHRSRVRHTPPRIGSSYSVTSRKMHVMTLGVYMTSRGMHVTSRAVHRCYEKRRRSQGNAHVQNNSIADDSSCICLRTSARHAVRDLIKSVLIIVITCTRQFTLNLIFRSFVTVLH